jgi:hypothetical protein
VVLAIEWYVDANSNPVVQPAIVAEQVGLELLAWAVLVQDEARLSANGFNRLPAHDQIRLLVSLMGAPTTISQPILTSLQQYARSQQIDGPEVLTRIRNTIVHPPNRSRPSAPPIETRVLFDAKKLGLWYLELALLWFTEYSGSYLSREAPSGLLGNPEPVPWTKP